MKILVRLLIILFCLACETVGAQNAPVSAVGVVFGNGPELTVPITATGINDIGSCNLQFVYDPAIALCTTVTAGALLPGGLALDLSVSGIISLGWYTWPGVTLPDNTVVFNLNFSKITSGTSAIAWDENYLGRQWSDGSFNSLNDLPFGDYYFDGSVTFQSYNAPLISIPDLTACQEASIDVPVTVEDFINIGAFTLTFNYNPSALTYQSSTNDSGFPGLTVDGTNSGVIVAEGYSTATNGVSLSGNSVLFTLHFQALGDSSEFVWYTDGTSCQYLGPSPTYLVLNDIPKDSFYFDGSFSAQPLPGEAGSIDGPPGGDVCQGQTSVLFSVPPVPYATAYSWALPAGAAITGGNGTNTITVSFDNNAISGNVTVLGSNDCGTGQLSPAFPINVNIAPVIVTQPVTPDTITAGEGVAMFEVVAEGSALNYRWQEYITSWNDVGNGGVYEGAYTAALTITNPPVSMNGYRYRCVVTGTCEPPAISDGTATLDIVIVIGIGSRKADNVSDKELNLLASPNPFTKEITFSFYSPEGGDMKIEIQNMAGQVVAKFSGRSVEPGNHALMFKPANILPGIYVARIVITTNKTMMSSTVKIVCHEN